MVVCVSNGCASWQESRLRAQAFEDCNVYWDGRPAKDWIVLAYAPDGQEALIEAQYPAVPPDTEQIFHWLLSKDERTLLVCHIALFPQRPPGIPRSCGSELDPFEKVDGLWQRAEDQVGTVTVC
jgi:hypothetical protein